MRLQLGEALEKRSFKLFGVVLQTRTDGISCRLEWEKEKEG